jgi:microcystin-dependent protein
MALETASYIAQLVPANPLSTDSVSQSDDHLRLIKASLKNTFPNLDGPVILNPTQLNNPVPRGIIAMWSGSLSALPPNWALCDGSTVLLSDGVTSYTTPDLRDRFIVGAGLTYPQGANGGSVTTGMAGSHTHTVNSATASINVTTTKVAAGADVDAITAVTPQGHTHTANLVGDHQHSSLPPYVALGYIIKI